MKKILIPSSLTFVVMLSVVEAFAQGPNTNIQINPQAQSQNINYYDQINDNNNSLGNTSNIINDDINPIQTNLGNQQANPPAEQQGISFGNIFGSGEQQNKPCTDCDEVKQAIKASHASSGSSYHRKPFSMKKWSRTFSGKMNLKMKKMFAKKYKAKTSYAICFNWH